MPSRLHSSYINTDLNIIGSFVPYMKLVFIKDHESLTEFLFNIL